MFRIGEKVYALDTTQVDGVMETEKVFFLPGRTGLVKGIISLRGEPVTVVDLLRVLNREFSLREKGPRKIIVVRENDKTLGLDIGPSDVSFLWEKKETGEAQSEVEYIPAMSEDTVEALDWTALWAEASRVLSSEG